MPAIGIVSVPKKNKSITGKLFSRVKIIKKFNENPAYIIAETFLDMDDICSINKFQLKYLIKKTEKILISHGADFIVFTNEFKNLTRDKINLDKAESFAIPKAKLLSAFKFAINANKYSNMLSNVAISDETLSLTDFNLLEEICFLTKKIAVYTNKIKEAEYISEKMYNRYGVYINVIQGTYVHPGSEQAIIDVDLRKIRVNDFTIDKAEFQSDLLGYNINSAEIAAFLNDNNNLKIKNWISGKNIIKIS